MRPHLIAEWQSLIDRAHPRLASDETPQPDQKKKRKQHDKAEAGKKSRLDQHV